MTLRRVCALRVFSGFIDVNMGPCTRRYAPVTLDPWVTSDGLPSLVSVTSGATSPHPTFLEGLIGNSSRPGASKFLKGAKALFTCLSGQTSTRLNRDMGVLVSVTPLNPAQKPSAVLTALDDMFAKDAFIKLMTVPPNDPHQVGPSRVSFTSDGNKRKLQMVYTAPPAWDENLTLAFFSGGNKTVDMAFAVSEGRIIVVAGSDASSKLDAITSSVEKTSPTPGWALLREQTKGDTGFVLIDILDAIQVIAPGFIDPVQTAMLAGGYESLKGTQKAPKKASALTSCRPKCLPGCLYYYDGAPLRPAMC